MTEDNRELFAEIVRDANHNLDLNDDDNKKIFDKDLYSFISSHEGIRCEAYDDANSKPIREILANNKGIQGNESIGIGFNMKPKEAKIEWEKIFGNKYNFEDLKTGIGKITEEDQKILYEHSVKTRTKEVENLYKNVWDKLRANEKMTIMSLYFNGSSSLVGKDTKFHKNIHEYVRTSDKQYLLKAVHEVEFHSNKDNSQGIAKRRTCEAFLLNSTKSSFYFTTKCSINITRSQNSLFA